jgi:anti-anti-sigma factor
MTADNLNNLLLYRDGRTACARVIGPINQQTILGFQQRLEGVLRDRCFTLTLDLGAAEYLDSDGIRWLQQLQTTLNAGDGELRLAVREGSRIDRTLRLLQLDRVFQIEHHQVEPGDPDNSVAYQLSRA